MKREKTTNLSRSTYSVITAVALLLGELVRSVASFLASCTKTSNENDASNNAAGGGVLNYRTGRVDDGTDPVGWYKED
jgi:hypothetical protein